MLDDIVRGQTPTSELAYDCNDFQVIFRPGRADLALVTFSSLGMFNASGSLADGHAFWARSLADKHDFTAVGFVAKHRNWFCSKYMPAAAEAAAKHLTGCTSVIAYGSSMGAYAALRWGKACGAGTVLAFAPQFSIDPAVVGEFDRRFAYAFEAERHRGMQPRSHHLADNTYLFYDPLDVIDRRHAELTSEVAAVRLTPLFACGHECVRAFAGGELALALFRACCEQGRDAVRRLAHDAKRKAAIRGYEIATRLLATKPGLAERIFRKHEPRFEIAQRAHFRARLATRDVVVAQSSIKHNIEQGVTEVRNRRMMSLDTKLDQQADLGIRSERQATQGRPFVHIHIPKTAGTALRNAFKQHNKGALRVFPHYDERRFTDANPADFDVFSGHFGYKTAAKLNGNTICIFRNPIDRFISVYYFWRQLHENGVEKSTNTRLASTYSLDEFVLIRDNPGLIEEFFNRITWQLAYGSSLPLRQELRELGKTEEEIYQLALANVGNLSLVGVQEDMATFTSRIEGRFGIRLQVSPTNITGRRLEVRDINISTLRRIQEWVYMDVELYNSVARM